MITFLTIMYVLFPDGQRVIFINEYQSSQECGDDLVNMATDDGYSFHCYETSILTRSPRPKARE